MVKRVTPSQFNSLIRQAQQRQRQSIDKYNREARAYNQKVKREAQRIDREVRHHNARVRADRQRLINEINRLNRQPTPSGYLEFRTTVTAVQTAYSRLNRLADEGRFDSSFNEVLDLSEREAANTAGVMNALLGDPQSTDDKPPDSEVSPLTPILNTLSDDLSNRWRGALYSLSPRNPDAARHFCTSAREIVARILDERAPDNAVVSTVPGFELTQNGKPTRRTKIRYILHMNGFHQVEFEEFVERDMNNVIELFHIFNKGTHGTSGAYDFAQLQSIRKRVEDGIMFLCRLVL